MAPSRRTGIALRQVRRLRTGDHGELNGIPVTAVPRTLLDLAADGHPRIRQLGEEAERLRLTWRRLQHVRAEVIATLRSLLDHPPTPGA
jgi:hypothetical protein